jgi:hypothetical protein
MASVAGCSESSKAAMCISWRLMSTRTQTQTRRLQWICRKTPCAINSSATTSEVEFARQCDSRWLQQKAKSKWYADRESNTGPFLTSKDMEEKDPNRWTIGVANSNSLNRQQYNYVSPIDAPHVFPLPFWSTLVDEPLTIPRHTQCI